MLTVATLILFAIVLTELAFESLVDWLNLKALDPRLPDEFKGYYDEDRYRTSQLYLKERTRFGFIQRGVTAVVLVLAVLLGFFNWADLIARGASESPIVAGLLFVGLLGGASWLAGLPFSLYSTFVIEEKYGFNRTTLKTYAGDQLKGLLLGAILGGLVAAAVFWFFESFGTKAWLWAWLMVTAIQLIMMFLAPVIILPLFNKYTPLASGELKTAIENFAQKENFKLEGIFTMDGSKRSTKANAFFTGFGRFRRIVLFDTLIAKQTVNELVAVLAHEIGHYKRRHIFRQLYLSIAVSGATFFLMGQFLNNEFFFEAFRVQNVSVYASLVFFGIFYSPISRVLSLYGLYLSRKYEFEADDYSVAAFKDAEALVTALKKLSVDNLANLKPHWLKVFVDYTHPPVLERIAALRAGARKATA
ncbi:MAG TPA: M48 family metallopeptidase [Bdellovibrionales bacterium]|nr:M48 family metallopeptidase [Bdellovibrionales bacterium]